MKVFVPMLARLTMPRWFGEVPFPAAISLEPIVPHVWLRMLVEYSAALMGDIRRRVVESDNHRQSGDRDGL